MTMTFSISRFVRCSLGHRCALVVAQSANGTRSLRYSTAVKSSHDDVQNEKSRKKRNNEVDDESTSSTPTKRGAMSRRLEEATEEALLSGGLAGRRAVEAAGFSDDLKERLLEKLADANFKTEFSGASTQAGLTSSSPSTGQSRLAHLSAAKPWTGTETTEDAVFRMLNDAKKPLQPADRGKFQPPVIDTRIRHQPRQSPGQRAGTARDRVTTYVGMDMKSTRGLSEEEREEMKQGLRDRFGSAATSMPVSISGMTALADRRIEDAIARGQFKDLPRGKEMERDSRADNPFIDTTEYIMNKMIQRQEMVPPWIEKQQELAKAVRVFRERLRNGWKRHASRMIAARGGTLDEQMKRAAAFAAAEIAHNPRYTSTGNLQDPAILSSAAAEKASGEVDEVHRLQRPFRDPSWEQAEKSYMELSIEKLNSMARSYNLMAPELAKKPYFSLERELNACYADVAPLVANEIKARAIGRSLVDKAPQSRSADGTLIEKLIGTDNVKIHVEADEKAYGLKEWWRDFWKRK